ncbi:hypothetical protein JMJ77_0010471 [Colletotrichum scovillei]|uniref:Uncharacterized protein n=1 Tax=Colletotrichum scovillei TaxID=1209932 RepID=A0A9P7UCD3_9PEZI|nr:hypothetical protein JMJ78_0011882 [Colletotrichum scovillei]KAG7042372.1 hypothetical protein JMJ77_0010471 [Colletotrichum scovillei]KAG7062406.1 hypothetical protein JMJ76_0006680 [Colletotrichum scovillei]
MSCFFFCSSCKGRRRGETTDKANDRSRKREHEGKEGTGTKFSSILLFLVRFFLN